MLRNSFILILCLTAISCKNLNQRPAVNTTDFDHSTLNSGLLPTKMISGQLLYLPVYSNIPYQIDTIKFDMSAFIAIHNTDLTNSIKLTKVLYFNQEGKLVNDYLKYQNIEIDPLATKDFYVPYEDQSGTGANFLIEWIADTLVNEPLIESITTCLKPNNTVAVLSQGKIIRERK
jgi:hypothetical protein